MNDNSGGRKECGVRCIFKQSRLETGDSNLQPVARVGREERTAEHQDAAQNIFLSHLEREGGTVVES